MFGKGTHSELLRELVQLRERVAELEADRARGLRLDSVTGLLSGRAFRGRLSEEVERARRYRRGLSVAVIAVDDFTAVEARHGFKAGDELLRAVARRLCQATRSHDLIGRTGHAEFGLLLPETEAIRALPSLQRLLLDLESVEEHSIVAPGASMGVAGLEPGLSGEGLLARARSACEYAQSTGGGRAVLVDELEREEPQGPRRDAVEALAVTLLERDRYTGEHSEAVFELAGAVAHHLGLSHPEVDRVKSAALLHDIGKVAIPDDVLHKSGPLTEDEWALIRQHPVIGERILRILPGLGTIARIVRHEHERWDGGGYPDGLVGEEIPLGSRIIIVADAYDAITSDRPYRSARSHGEAVEELTRCAGTQFDPSATAALVGYLYGARQAGLAVAR
jgi:diguanylate cyclase (GGDEF)-like protein/putative nucleotidyltransferase with HDIG domain